MSYLPIANHGLIGNLRTAAMVGLDGTIDFLSFPEFDSPTVFASLLDQQRGGFFSIAPVLGEPNLKQIYLPDTCVLLTRFLAETGVAEITDFMPMVDEFERHALIRRVATVRGEIQFRLRCAPRFDYGRTDHDTEIARNGDEVVFRSRGDDATTLRLRSEVPLALTDGDATAEFTLRAGESADFFLEDAAQGRSGEADLCEWCGRAFERTVAFWREWAGRCSYRGRWYEQVLRSALTLKLLQSDRYGSLVAAATFGLPEHVGGRRNWDYRYSWIRDSAFTVYALLGLGYTDEAARFMDWIEARCGESAESGSLQVMYGIDGRHDLSEAVLDHLEGYGGSRPVRIGNAAYDQLQLDIYGELIDSVYLYDKYGMAISHDFWLDLARLVEWVCDHWQLADEGIWEVRGGRREFLFSRLMCWVAIDRAIRLSSKRSLPAPLDRWRTVRDAIHQEIYRCFWNDEIRAFVQTEGSSTVDASCLRMPLTRFIGPTDPRWLSTLDAVDRRLANDALVYRYRVGEAADDGLDGDEGTFNMCSFWFVECLARAGQVDRARLLFDKMLGFGNHLGLYSEETGPRGEHLGNFPQAFTHLGLITAAFALDRQYEKINEPRRAARRRGRKTS
jgi:pentatricopeptide repeat protein